MASEWEGPIRCALEEHPKLEAQIEALRRVLADRERELLELKGPCSNRRCSLHYAHSGPCDTEPTKKP